MKAVEAAREYVQSATENQQNHSAGRAGLQEKNIWATKGDESSHHHKLLLATLVKAFFGACI